MNLVRVPILREKLLSIFRFPVHFPRGAEIGVQRGIYSEYLIKAGRFSKFYCIDSWQHVPGRQDGSNVSQDQQDLIFFQACKRLAQFGYRVEIIRSSSSKAVERFLDNSLDFIYIDADHTYDGCIADLECYYPKLKEDGVMAGHDFLDGYYGSIIQTAYGVRSAITDFVMEEGISSVGITEGDFPSWFFFKDKRNWETSLKIPISRGGT